MTSEAILPQDVHAFMASLRANPEAWKAIKDASTEAGRLEAMNSHVAALRTAAEASKAEARAEWMVRMDKQFADVPFARVLAGQKVPHRVTFSGIMAFDLVMPAAAKEHEVRTAMRNANDPATTESEVLLVAWLAGMQLLQPTGNGNLPPPVSFDGQSPPELLSKIRQLSSLVVDRLAQECMDMRTWLGIKLEQNLGNS